MEMTLNSQSSSGTYPCKCGGNAKVDLGMILTSNPPMYSARCESCNQNFYVYTADYHAQLPNPLKELQDRVTALEAKLDRVLNNLANNVMDTMGTNQWRA